MKKSMFWLAVLMMGVSTALWTGCSDDDDEGPVDTTPVVTTSQFKIEDKVDDYLSTTKITRTDNVVTAIEKEMTTDLSDPESKETTKINYKVTSSTGKVVVTYKENDVDYTLTYTLNTDGFAKEASLAQTASLNKVITYKIVYGTDKMLEKCYYTQKKPVWDDETGEEVVKDVDLVLFDVKCDANKDWKTYTIHMGDDEDGDGEEDVMVYNCAPHTMAMPADYNLNMLMLNYGSDPVMDCAILCDLFPWNAHLVKTLTESTGMITPITVTPVEEGGKLKSITVRGGVLPGDEDEGTEDYESMNRVFTF